jgi:hypothetical protein
MINMNTDSDKSNVIHAQLSEQAMTSDQLTIYWLEIDNKRLSSRVRDLESLLRRLANENRELEPVLRDIIYDRPAA